MNPVILNTTVISNFAAIGQIDVLRTLFGSINIAIEVYEELLAGIEEGYDFYRNLDGAFAPFSSGGWIQIVSLRSEEEIKTFGQLPAGLHKGESASLAIAQHRGWVFLTDDRAARTASRAAGVAISGSIGCLVACVERELIGIEEANRWLHRMVGLGFRSPIVDLREILQ